MGDQKKKYSISNGLKKIVEDFMYFTSKILKGNLTIIWAWVDVGYQMVDSQQTHSTKLAITISYPASVSRYRNI